MGLLYKAVVDKAKTFEEVIKFNPYHDAKGRFTSSGGATSFTYKPGASKAHDMAIAREKARTEAENAKNGANAKITEAENKLKGVLSEKATVSLKGVDPEIADDIYHSVAKVMTKFPSVVDSVEGIEAFDANEYEHFRDNPNVMACFNTGDRKIRLNNAYFGNKEEMARKYAEGVDRQWNPAGTDYKSVVTHEIGHAVDYYVSRKIDGLWGVMGNNSTTATKIWNADIEKMRKKSPDGKATGKMFRENLSGYSAHSPSEYVAEGFAEFMDSPSPRPTAKSIGRRLTNAINKAAKEGY